MTCVHCYQTTENDGYGEHVHKATGLYACHDGVMPKNPVIE